QRVLQPKHQLLALVGLVLAGSLHLVGQPLHHRAQFAQLLPDLPDLSSVLLRLLFEQQQTPGVVEELAQHQAVPGNWFLNWARMVRVSARSWSISAWYSRMRASACSICSKMRRTAASQS